MKTGTLYEVIKPYDSCVGKWNKTLTM